MKKSDVIIIGTIILFSVIGIVATQFFQSSSSGDLDVLIRHGGTVIKRIPLNALTDDTFVYLNNNERNEIIIKDGRVWIEEANCRDQICVNHRAISKNGELIVCLPHQLVVEIHGRIDDVLIDSIAE